MALDTLNPMTLSDLPSASTGLVTLLSETSIWLEDVPDYCSFGKLRGVKWTLNPPNSGERSKCRSS